MRYGLELAATRLAEARLRGVGSEPVGPEGPASIDDALAVQWRVLEILQERTAGWKCSVPSGDRMIVAPLPASTIQRGTMCAITPQNGLALFEPEVAFVLGQDLPPRQEPYSAEETRSAIRETRIVLELMGTRYRDHASIHYFEALADSFRNAGLLVGPEIPAGLDAPLESFHLQVRSAVTTLVDRPVDHPNGHPLRPLVWLANFLSSRGQSLSAGQIIKIGRAHV